MQNHIGGGGVVSRLEELWPVVVQCEHVGRPATPAAGAGLDCGFDTTIERQIQLSAPPRSQPCNPAVGGPAKSQLVHEVDALGGEIGRMADRCYLQKRVLNRSKVGRVCC